jgi:hypothetical protein
MLSLAVKGLVRVGQGFSVSAGKLRAGSQDVGALLDRCLLIAEDSVDALAGMADSAGHPGLASALSGAVGQGARTFWAMGTACRHVSASLAASADNYADTEQAVAARARALLGELG